MTIKELLTSEESPLTEEQRHELQNEYFAEVSELNRKIRNLESKNDDLSKDMDNFAKICNKQCELAKGAMIAVKAMINASGNATHRMRDFYGEAIVRYIERIEPQIGTIKKEDLLPF